MLCLAGAPACGESPGGSTATREVLADGTVVLRYASASAIPVDTLSPDMAIGKADGEPWEVFGYVEALDVSPDGSIFVLDTQLSVVRVFDRNGSYRSSLGGRGQGPGELLQPNGMRVGRDGRIWIRDQGARHVVVLDFRGTEAARYPLPANGSGSFQWEGRVDQRGVLWQAWQHVETPSATLSMATTGLTEGVRRYFARSFDPTSLTSDSILVGELPVRFVRWPQGRGYASAAVTFDPQIAIAVAPDGTVWSAETNAYRVRATAPDGGQRVVELNVTAPLADPEKRAFWEAMIAASESGLDVPEREQTILRLLTDDAGRLWVQRVVPLGEPALLDVFDAGGAALGSVRIQSLASAVAPVVRDGYFYGVVLDALDVPSVIRARLPRTVR